DGVAVRPEPAQVLAQVLTPLAAALALRLRRRRVLVSLRRVGGRFSVLLHVRQVVEPPVLVVFDEAPVALPRRAGPGETFGLVTHDLVPRRRGHVLFIMPPAAPAMSVPAPARLLGSRRCAAGWPGRSLRRPGGVAGARSHPVGLEQLVHRRV